jgi:transposase
MFAMPSKRREQELLDRTCERVRPLLPPEPLHPKGGRPFVDDKDCFAGIVYLLRNNVRWNNLPDRFPSGVTCWRRHRDWTRAGVWGRVWVLVVEELAEAALLDVTELFLDATFAEARKGGRASAALVAASA